MKSTILSKQSRYRWSGISNLGEKIQGEMDAKNKFYVTIYLKDKGIKPLKIDKQWITFPDRLKEQDIALICRQISTLINAGIPIVQACHTLATTHDKLPAKKLISSLQNNIESGKSLSDGLQQYPHYFDSFMCHVIRLGEQTGKLDDALDRAANYKEKHSLLKKQILQALLYPAIISIVAIVITLVMLIGIVPRFAELFQTMHHQLPALTRTVISLSNYIRDDYWFLLAPITGCIIFMKYYARSNLLQNKAHQFVLKMPIFGVVIHKIILARFARNLLTTYSAGLSIIDSLNILSSSTTNQLYALAFQQLKRDITRGLQLHAAMQLNPLFSGLEVQMIKVGEESGNLESMLSKIAVLYERDIEYFITNLKHLMEPLIMIILGVLIGGLIVAMYLPIFKLGTVI